MVFKIFLNLCCHLNLHGVGRSKRHWLIFTMTRLALYAWSRMSTLKYQFDPWVAASVNAIFPLQIPVDKYL